MSRRKRHSKEEQSIETLIQFSDHREEIALAQKERRLKETKLEGWIKLSKLQR